MADGQTDGQRDGQTYDDSIPRKHSVARQKLPSSVSVSVLAAVAYTWRCRLMSDGEVERAASERDASCSRRRFAVNETVEMTDLLPQLSQ